jgi:hypothetical protein
MVLTEKRKEKKKQVINNKPNKMRPRNCMVREKKTYIYGGPEYFADKLDEIGYFEGWIRNLDKAVKYIEKVRKCLLDNVIRGSPVLV